MPLYEVAMILKPTKKEHEAGEIEKLLYGPKPILAKDANTAAFEAMRSDAVPSDADLSRIDVLIRPFSA